MDLTAAVCCYLVPSSTRTVHAWNMDCGEAKPFQDYYHPYYSGDVVESDSSR